LKTQGNEFNSKFTITIYIEMIIMYICNYERSVLQLLDYSGFWTRVSDRCNSGRKHWHQNT